MKRKIVIIVSVILVLVMVSLYYTYATDISMDNTTGDADLTYNIDIKDTSGRSITVKAGSTKTFDIFITNNNGGTINYGLAYSPTKADGITIAQVNTSKNKVSELIENNTTHQISLIIINNTSNDVTYNIIPVTGYEKGGDLVVPTGYTLISDVYSYPIKPKRMDESGANIPKLADGMVPVVYDESKSSWVKANITDINGDYKWYDYNNKKWANAVLVRDTGYVSSLSESNKSVSIDNTPTSSYTSSNQGKNSTTSTSTFTFTTGSTAGYLSFDYSVSSESNYDKLTIKVNDTTAVNAISGTKSSTYRLALTANTEYVITASYSKDGSSASGDDQATISNIVVPSGSSSIVVAASGNYGWTENLYSLITYSSYTMLDNGTYILSGGSKVSSTDAINKYICSDITSTECNQIYQIKTNSSDTITSVDVYETVNKTGIRNPYITAENGTVIAEEDILAYYVWIPRYKYKVWNITKTVGTDSYDAYHTGIDIVFESGTESSGTITCNDYSFAEPNSSTPNETCSGTNGEYYTHPAFTFGDKELEGIWVGKFEVSSSRTDLDYGGGNKTSLKVRVKPNVTSWRNNSLTNFSYVIQNMQVTDNEYGLTTDKTVADSHMMKNMEWGAVAYLTNSNYGRCSNGTCTEIEKNSYSGFKTGCGPQSAGSTSSGSTCNEYTTALGQLASTTGNVYGIYDMSGGAYEYVMGNMSSGSGSYTYYADGAGGSFTYTTETAKYLDTYAYGTSDYDQTAYNRARLGDATGENMLTASLGGGWYDDQSLFVYSSDSWFLRGGDSGGVKSAGAFNFYFNTGGGLYLDFVARCVVVLP